MVEEAGVEFVMFGLVIAFHHLLPLLGLDHRQPVFFLDVCNLVHNLHALPKQLAQLVVHIFEQGALADEFAIGHIGGKLQFLCHLGPFCRGELLGSVAQRLFRGVVTLHHQAVETVRQRYLCYLWDVGGLAA